VLKVSALEDGKDRFNNLGDAEECEDHRWVEAQSDGRYRLAELGRRKSAKPNST
jgi:hypothetical protein